MSPANRRRTHSICLFIVIALLLIVYLAVITYTGTFRNRKIVPADLEAISLLEKHFGVKFFPSTQRISTCYDYDASGCEWGVLFVLKSEDVAAFCDISEWELLTDKREIERLYFPSEFDIRGVMVYRRVKWWNPNSMSEGPLYIRKSKNRTIKMFIENASGGWVRVFLIMEAYDRDMPYERRKIFEDSSCIDILIREHYHDLPENVK